MPTEEWDILYDQFLHEMQPDAESPATAILYDYKISNQFG
jgi:hypothetical protein